MYTDTVQPDTPTQSEDCAETYTHTHTHTHTQHVQHADKS